MSVQLTIDGFSIRVDQGTTILQAARQHEIDIPTLCDYPELPAHGSCRMCIVEIQGKPNTPTACTTPAEAGMIIQTNSPRIKALRGELLQMLLADHPSSCLFCPEKSHCAECMVTLNKAGVTTGCRSCSKDGQCELQALVEKISPDQIDYPPRYHMEIVKKNDPFFDRDYNLCVLCGRCVRLCEKLHFAESIALSKRGSETVVSTAFSRAHLDANCVFCGACVAACPTGALAEKTRKWVGKPDKETVSTCPLCSLGCQIRLLSKNNRVIGSLPINQLDSNYLCVKGRFGITELVNHPTRLTVPQKYTGSQRLSISWDEAIQIAAQKLRGVSPDKFEMIVSPDCSLENLYIAQKFTRQGIKSTNIHTIDSFGSPNESDQILNFLKQSQPLSILNEAETIVVFGLENIYSQSPIEVRLHDAQKVGSQILAILSESSNLGPYADFWLRLMPGKEIDLVQALSLQLTRLVKNDKGYNRDLGRPVNQAARLLSESKNTVFILGPDIFSHPGIKVILTAVSTIIQLIHGRVITIPNQNIHAGALLMGISGRDSLPSKSHPQVLYLFGENYPDYLVNEQSFILYQNIYPPSSGRKPDLTFPLTAFSEEEGSLIDYTGLIKEIHHAVIPPAQSLPGWVTICRIAQELGLNGFDFTGIEDIRAEMAGSIKGYQINQQIGWSSIVPSPLGDSWNPPSTSGNNSGLLHEQTPIDYLTDRTTYLGFPLSQFVQGLGQLRPTATRKNNG